MRKTSFRKFFTLRSREAIVRLRRIPLTEVNRSAVESAARNACLNAVLAANDRLVQACHDISVLASSASAPGVPEGPSRLKLLRAALRRAEWSALRGAEWSSEFREDAASQRPKPIGRCLPDCPYARTRFIRGKIPVQTSLLERAKALDTGLRLLRFRPQDLRKTPEELEKRLSALALRGYIRGLYALTGRGDSSPVKEFVLFVPDFSPDEDFTAGSEDPLAGLPVRGLIRTVLHPGKDSAPDLRGLERVIDLPSWNSSPNIARPPEGAETDETREKRPAVSAVKAPEGAGKLVPGSFAAQAVQEGATLEGEYRNATVLYVDTPSFLSLVKPLTPERSAELLNLLFSRFVRCVEATDGVADAFVGSSLYAFWGAPAATGREASSAADAALAMRRALRGFNRTYSIPGKRARMACGLDSSAVLAGRLGSKDRRTYTVAGEAPKQACLIGALNESLGTDILVSDYTLRLIGNEFLTYPIDPTRGGKMDHHLYVHVLLGRRDDPKSPRDLKDLRELLSSVE